MNIMIRDPYYLAKTVLGSYNLYILKDPFGSWHYSCVGTFNTKDEAIDYYHKLKEEEKMISRMHMKLNKKTERLIKRRAAELKKLYETPNPEVDKIISELRAEATKRPQNMSKEEEIAYILKKADENCDHIEIRKILNVSNT